MVTTDTSLQAPRTFKADRPEMTNSKKVLNLCKSDLLIGQVQYITEGGENKLHHHTGQDGFWFVLAGQFRFYGEGDELIAELNPQEGLLMPRGVNYWFESTGEDVGELLHVAARDPRVDDRRIGESRDNKED